MKLYVALLHHPVYKKNGEIITTSITPLDLHDIARSSFTYDVKGFFVVNPLPTMIYLAHRITGFWTSDYGQNYNRTRTDALSIMHIVEHLEDCFETIVEQTGKKPKLVATSAKRFTTTVTFQDFRELLKNDDQPYLMLLGTGYGLIRELVERCDYVLEPIEGAGSYNHLSVRSAAAIMLDRLCRKENIG